MDPAQPLVTPVPTASNTPPPSMTPPAMKPPHVGKSFAMKKVLWIFLALFFVAASLWTVTWEYGMKYGSKSQSVQTAGIQVVPTPILDPTANWKTYTDTANGYLIKYPSGWFLQECPNDSTCAKTDTSIYFKTINPNNPPPSSAIPHTVWITYFPNPNAKEFKDVATENQTLEVKNNFTYTEESINNQTVYRSTSLPSETPGEWAFFKNSTGNYIAIGFTPASLGNDNDPTQAQAHMKYYDEFNQMLKSFAFVENITLTPSPSPAQGVACTQEAKQCANGSYVSRSGPNCEFAACPK